jgi:hypothetical protein
VANHLGRWAVLGNHIYQRPGSLTLSVQVNDAGGSSSSTAVALSVSPEPTSITITGVTDKFSLLSETETVTAQVSGPVGLPVNGGSVTLTDGGQTQTVSVVNGQATATFKFNLLQELKVVSTHTVTGNFSDLSGGFGSSSTSFQAKANLFGFLFQLALDEALVKAFASGIISRGRMMTSGSSTATMERALIKDLTNGNFSLGGMMGSVSGAAIGQRDSDADSDGD